MFRPPEQAEEDEARRHGCVQTAEENDCRNHKGERHLLVHVVERTKGGRLDILVAAVCVDDGTDDTEDDDLGYRAGPERLGEFAAIVISFGFLGVLGVLS